MYACTPTRINTVEVFRTNVQDLRISFQIVQRLQLQFPDSSINFDLEDCDRILRIEGRMINNVEVIRLLNACGYFCEALD